MDWKTRLAIKFTVDGTTTLISPIDSFSPSFTPTAETYHSVERTHVGVIYSPVTVNFTMSVRAIGPVAAQLTKLALIGQQFDIVMLEQEGNDWSFASLLLSNCVITSASPSNATISGAPVATFSGFSRGLTMTDNDQASVRIPNINA